MIFFPFHSNSDGKFHLTMTITLEFNDDHDGLEMEMSEQKYTSDPNLNKQSFQRKPNVHLEIDQNNICKLGKA